MKSVELKKGIIPFVLAAGVASAAGCSNNKAPSHETSHQINLLHHGIGSNAVTHSIGRTVHGYIDVDNKKTKFGYERVIYTNNYLRDVAFFTSMEQWAKGNGVGVDEFEEGCFDPNADTLGHQFDITDLAAHGGGPGSDQARCRDEKLTPSDFRLHPFALGGSGFNVHFEG